jgi:hypothetical protein
VTRLAAALLVTSIAAALAATAGGAPAAEVTLTVERYFDPACTPVPGMAPSPIRGGCPRLRFAGTISSGAAGEYVSVLYQRCGSSGLGTSLVGAQTNDRGAWDTFWGVTSGTFRARWGSALSSPVRFRDSVRLSLARLSATRQRVYVSGDQDMKGRIVELQRLVSGQWRTLRRTRLVADRSSWGVNSSATFTVRQPGLTLRAFIPAKSAAPCYAATASETWTSGVRPGTPSGAGARVIDRTLLCATDMQGGIRMFSIRATSASGSDAYRQGPSIYASSGFSQVFASASSTSLSYGSEQCTQTRARVRLEAGTLRPARPGRSGRSFDCEAPRVLVRLRAVFREPAALESNSDSRSQTLFARGEVLEAAVAIRTPSGKRLAFATISASGKTRLFAAPSCVEDDT